ncbi:MAG: biotin transporter BioY [Erysipelotrichaceae bacterium]|nr:biotin transporter BioY [Erysipelotrichaceae bacterium]
MSIKQMTRCAIMAALICVLSPISVPLSSLVPISLATLTVMLAGVLLGSKEGTISVIIYLLLGMVGLPVFAGYSSGPTVLFGVTGGFLFGYIPLAFISGLAIEKKDDYKSMILGMLIGNLVLYVIGTIWFMIYLKASLGKALGACVIPFIPGDIIKMIIVCLIAPRIRPLLNK